MPRNENEINIIGFIRGGNARLLKPTVMRHQRSIFAQHSPAVLGELLPFSDNSNHHLLSRRPVLDSIDELRCALLGQIDYGVIPALVGQGLVFKAKGPRETFDFFRCQFVCTVCGSGCPWLVVT